MYQESVTSPACRVVVSSSQVADLRTPPLSLSLRRYSAAGCTEPVWARRTPWDGALWALCGTADVLPVRPGPGASPSSATRQSLHRYWKQEAGVSTGENDATQLPRYKRKCIEREILVS